MMTLLIVGLTLSPQSWEYRLLLDKKFKGPLAKKLALVRHELDKRLKNIVLNFQDSVSNNEVERFLILLKKEFPSENAFKEVLKELGISEEDLKKEIKSELAVFKWIDKEIAEIMPVESTTVFVPEARVYREIYISAPPYISSLQRFIAKLKAWKIWLLLRYGGRSFQSVAKEYSYGRTSEMGGIREPIFYDPLNKISKTLFSLGLGEISKPIETSWGYYILKLEAILPEHFTKFGDLSQSQRREVLNRILRQTLERSLGVSVE